MSEKAQQPPPITSSCTTQIHPDGSKTRCCESRYPTTPPDIRHVEVCHTVTYPDAHDQVVMCERFIRLLRPDPDDNKAPTLLLAAPPTVRVVPLDADAKPVRTDFRDIRGFARVASPPPQ